MRGCGRSVAAFIRFAEQPRCEHREASQGQPEPGRTVRGLVADFVGRLLDQEQVEQNAFRLGRDERMHRVADRFTITVEETLLAFFAESVEQRALAIRRQRGGVFLWRSCSAPFLDVRQEGRQQADRRQEGAQVGGGLDAGLVGDPEPVKIFWTLSC